ncbi:MAG: serine protease, partial [Pseudomonadota bacterium]
MRKFISFMLLAWLGMVSFSLQASDRTTRIVGGTEVTDFRYPWMASVYFRSSGTLFLPGCGGSLISDRWILSAAHCFVDRETGVRQSVDDIAVLLGALNLSSDDGLFIRASQLVVHPDYDPQTFRNDIALIELVSSVDLQPITLPTPANPVPQAGELATVAGWGRTSEGGSSSSQLLEVDLPIVTHNSCLAFYANSLNQNAMVCAGGARDGGQDACQGDSGGPLFVPRGNQNVQAGVVSFGVGCARPGIPGVYTRLSSYFNWISGFVSPASVYNGQSENSVVSVPDAVETLLPNTRVQASVSQGDTIIYLARSTNRVVLETLQGDADLGVFSSRNFSEATLVCSSRLAGGGTDQCDLSSIGDYYVAVAGYASSEYTLAVSNGAAPVTDVQVQTLRLDIPV